MSIPAELRYTPEHEWVSIEGTTASVGITEYAAQQLGNVVYVSLPPVARPSPPASPAARSNRSSRSATCTPRWTAR